MCTVMGTLAAMPRETFERSLARTHTRGPDAQRVLPLDGGGFLGFQRLAIMGPGESGMQPFCLGPHTAVCNGELYGFRAQKRALQAKGYSFRSGSDCELLLPLYLEYGLAMFARLDAEFACILYDGARHRLIAARDPIGIRPLFYGYWKGEAVFASEAKNLVGLVDEVRPFPPGHYYADGAFTPYCDITAARPHLADGEEEACCAIRKKLTAAVEKRLDADAPLGFLLSGGLDSSLVCAIAARKLPGPIRTFAIGMEHDAIDLKYARQAADFLGAQHTEVYMTREEAIASLDEVIAALGTFDITTVRASVGMYLVCKAIHRQTDIRVLLTGEVSDELFGYKYTDFAPGPQAFEAESRKRVRELHLYDVLRADRCISSNSLEARVPFGDLDFVRYVMHLRPALKMNTHGKGKYLLRKAFAQGGYLPETILWREKAAFSDAVGHSLADELKAYAESIYSDEDLARAASRYAHVPPFTKESLLYRDIFEKYYPGQGGMIPAFWMPNREWAGCDVTDPSARVLANYGASGL